MQIVSLGDNLHELSDPIFYGIKISSVCRLLNFANNMVSVKAMMWNTFILEMKTYINYSQCVKKTDHTDKNITLFAINWFKGSGYKA